MSSGTRVGSSLSREDLDDPGGGTSPGSSRLTQGGHPARRPGLSGECRPLCGLRLHGRQTVTAFPGRQAAHGPQTQPREAGRGCPVTHLPLFPRVSMENEVKREPEEKRYVQSASVSQCSFP